MKDILEGFKVSSERARVTNRPRAVSSLLAEVHKTPDNELLSTEQLVIRCKMSKSYGAQYIGCADLEPFRCMIQRRYLWGNEKTIQKLKARIKNAH